MKRAEPILGGHLSISGGLYRAVERAAEIECQCLQIFTTPPRGWGVSSEPLDAQTVQRFQNRLADLHLQSPLSHATYLINLGSPDQALWTKSVDALVSETRRCAQLGIPCLVLHPGAAMGASEEAGLARVLEGLQEMRKQTMDMGVCCLLETTAGQGSQLGHRLEHLAWLLDRLQDAERFGVCLDTCHLFAAGYPLTDPKEYEATMETIDRTVGLKQVHAIHVNDSKQPLGSRRDRHEHIGQGKIGAQAFRNLLLDPRTASIPMYLETPPEKLADDLTTLRQLLVASA